jgi:16S rRNA (guanine(527)-N(7))-methyltransferase RsmG
VEGTSDSAPGMGPDASVTGEAVGLRKAKPAAEPGIIDALFHDFGVTGTPVEGRLRVLIEEIQADKVPEKYGRDIIHLIADSLSGVQVAGVAGSEFAADIGSGYGFPGLVLAAALAETEFTLLDLDPVRSDFLKSTSEKMGLTNVSVVNWPVEDWSDGIGRCDFVAARNVALLPTVVEWAAPLLKLGGSGLFWARARDEVEEQNAKAAADATGMRPAEVLRLSNELMGGDTERRHVHIYTKQAETPPEFPRARKAALKRPIMAATGGRPQSRWDEAVRKRTMDQEKKRELEANRRSKQRRGTRRPVHKRLVKAVRRVLVRVKGPRDPA